MPTLLENSIAAAKKGDKGRAMQYISRAVQEEPKNITAWLWLSTLVDEAQQKAYCYQRVLALDPKNEHALKGMQQLGIQNGAPAVNQPFEEPPRAPDRNPVTPEPPKKKFEYIESIESPYQPSWDIYQPHMPSVDLYSDMEGFFENARLLGHKASDSNFLSNFYKDNPEYANRITRPEEFKQGDRFITVVSPGRIIMLFPAHIPENAPENIGESILPTNKQNLRITAVSYTYMEAVLSFANESQLTDEERKAAALKCIPFLGQLMGYTGQLGHSVVVFEGHSSAFEAGVRDSDVLFIDSAMLQFLQEDWAEVAFRCMKPYAKIYIHEREGYKLRSVVRTKTPPGWEYGIGLGNERTYIHFLFTFLGEHNLRGKHIILTAGKRLPDVSKLTNEPDELELLSKVPFHYELLDAKTTMDLILKSSEKKFLSSARTYKVQLRKKGTSKILDLVFNIKPAQDANKNMTIDIWLE